MIIPPESTNEFSPLPRRSPHSWGHSDQPGVGRGHGAKIREYSPTLREDPFETDDQGEENDDNDSDEDYIP